MVAQTTTCYKQGILDSISKCTTQNLEADMLQQQQSTQRAALSAKKKKQTAIHTGKKKIRQLQIEK